MSKFKNMVFISQSKLQYKLMQINSIRNNSDFQQKFVAGLSNY